jgi:hypothetical protein
MLIAALTTCNPPSGLSSMAYHAHSFLKLDKCPHVAVRMIIF